MTEGPENPENPSKTVKAKIIRNYEKIEKLIRQYGK